MVGCISLTSVCIWFSIDVVGFVSNVRWSRYVVLGVGSFRGDGLLLELSVYFTLLFVLHLLLLSSVLDDLLNER